MANNASAGAPPAKVRVRVLRNYCKGCGLCVGVCPREKLRLLDEVNERGLRYVGVVGEAACTGCGNCTVVCPDTAIIIEEIAE